MALKTRISDFTFRIISYGRYQVTYTSPVTGHTWQTQTTNMPLIDNTKNEDSPTIKNLNILKSLCKQGTRIK